MTRLWIPAALLLTLPLLWATPPAVADEVVANTGTARIRFAAREWLDVGLDVNGVRVERLKLRQPGRLRGLFTRHDEANRGRIVVTNRTGVNVNPALAIAIFDEDGHLLGAANTGARLRTVRPGQTAEFDVHFGGVFRHLDGGDYIYVSIEY